MGIKFDVARKKPQFINVLYIFTFCGSFYVVTAIHHYRFSFKTCWWHRVIIFNKNKNVYLSSINKHIADKRFLSVHSELWNILYKLLIFCSCLRLSFHFRCIWRDSVWVDLHFSFAVINNLAFAKWIIVSRRFTKMIQLYFIYYRNAIKPKSYK